MFVYRNNADLAHRAPQYTGRSREKTWETFSWPRHVQACLLERLSMADSSSSEQPAHLPAVHVDVARHRPRVQGAPSCTGPEWVLARANVLVNCWHSGHLSC